ncbi:hypothetical protein C8Q77DRAFT_1082492 [Trametes polyzona]|nr:hypothetical protein C8Q77DRAFT_1082492 [Trametes polyzona]
MSSIPRSQSVPHVGSLKITTTDLPGSRTTTTTRPKLPRHRSSASVSSTHQHQPLASLYSPRSEREDPFSLGGFFPTNLGAFENSPAEQEWDWLHREYTAGGEDVVDFDGSVRRSRASSRSGLVSPISEDDEWDIPTPCSAFADAGDALARDTIQREDKLGILALGDKLSLASHGHGEEAYVDDRLLSPYRQAGGDPLDDEAVYDALRALRTAHSRPRGSAVKHDAGSLHELFSPEKEADDKMKVEADGSRWGTLVSWGVSRVVDYISPV